MGGGGRKSNEHRFSGVTNQQNDVCSELTESISPLLQQLYVFLMPLKADSQTHEDVLTQFKVRRPKADFNSALLHFTLTSSLTLICSSLIFFRISTSAAFLLSTFRLWKPVKYSLRGQKRKKLKEPVFLKFLHVCATWRTHVTHQW